ncbi:MAG: DUF1588 domain-containing protein [Myxococcota bacterium]
MNVAIRLVSSVALLAGCQGTFDGGMGGPGSTEEPATETPEPDPERPTLTALFQCDENAPRLPPRLVRLSERQYAATIQAAFAINGEDPMELSNLPFGLVNEADRFSTRSRSYRVGEADVEPVLAAARSIAGDAVHRLSRNNASCLAGGGEFESCLRTIVKERGQTLFHRPLTEEEITTYVGAAAADAASLDREIAASTAIEAMLRAPQFLFRSELGAMNNGQLELTTYELASAISYAITDGPPDTELWASATQGTLSDPVEIENHVSRLLARPENNGATQRFIEEYIHYNYAPDAGKSDTEFPEHDPQGLVQDTDRFVRSVLETNGRLDFLNALLTSETAFARPSTAWSYGLEMAGGNGAQEISVANERIGILLQPSWLVSFSEPDKNQPIQRGKFIRETFLCDDLPALPIPDIEPLAPGENQTLRETLEMHRANPACAECHDRMDPLGLPFEQFDHLGRFRTMEQGRPVVTTGGIVASGPDTDGPVEGPTQMVRRLAESPMVRQCFISHAFEYWIGLVPDQRVGCAMVGADQRFETNQDLVGLVATFFSSDAFRIREESR